MTRTLLSTRYRKRRGAALLMAISLLALFTMLGMIYVRGMAIENDRADLDLRRVRARNTAEAGVNAALAELERALKEGQAGQIVGQAKTYAFPAYKRVQGDTGFEVAPSGNRRASADVTIHDESGKINLNHAPASVLQAILGVDGATARKITSSLPRSGVASDETRDWLLDIDDLVRNGLLTEEELAQVERSLVTTYTVVDHRRPRRFLNLNAASAPVLAALTGAPLETAEQALDERPFKTLDAVAQAVGKDPATFNVSPDPFNPSALPAPLAFESRCFRVVSEASYAKVAGEEEYHVTRARAEVVVLRDDYGDYQILRWSTQRETESEAEG